MHRQGFQAARKAAQAVSWEAIFLPAICSFCFAGGGGCRPELKAGEGKSRSTDCSDNED